MRYRYSIAKDGSILVECASLFRHWRWAVIAKGPFPLESVLQLFPEAKFSKNTQESYWGTAKGVTCRVSQQCGC